MDFDKKRKFESDQGTSNQGTNNDWSSESVLENVVNAMDSTKPLGSEDGNKGLESVGKMTKLAKLLQSHKVPLKYVQISMLA